MTEVATVAMEARAMIADTVARLGDCGHHFGDGSGTRQAAALDDIAARCHDRGLWTLAAQLDQLARDVRSKSSAARSAVS